MAAWCENSNQAIKFNGEKKTKLHKIAIDTLQIRSETSKLLFSNHRPSLRRGKALNVTSQGKNAKCDVINKHYHLTSHGWLWSENFAVFKQNDTFLVNSMRVLVAFLCLWFNNILINTCDILIVNSCLVKHNFTFVCDFIFHWAVYSNIKSSYDLNFVWKLF